jgi:hypothetical protein
VWRPRQHSLTRLQILKSLLAARAQETFGRGDQSPGSKDPNYYSALLHRRTISAGSGTDSRNISCRREDTCFSRTPEATPHRKSRAPSVSVRGGAEGCNSEQPAIAKGGVSENGPRLWHGPLEHWRKGVTSSSRVRPALRRRVPGAKLCVSACC